MKNKTRVKRLSVFKAAKNAQGLPKECIWRFLIISNIWHENVYNNNDYIIMRLPSWRNLKVYTHTGHGFCVVNPLLTPTVVKHQWKNNNYEHFLPIKNQDVGITFQRTSSRSYDMICKYEVFKKFIHRQFNLAFTIIEAASNTLAF